MPRSKDGHAGSAGASPETTNYLSTDAGQGQNSTSVPVDGSSSASRSETDLKAMSGGSADQLASYGTANGTDLDADKLDKPRRGTDHGLPDDIEEVRHAACRAV